MNTKKKQGGVGIAGAVSGLSPREQYGKTHEKDEERYRMFLDSIEDGCYELDLAGNLTFFNSRLTDIAGYSQEEMLGKNYKDYTDEEAARSLFEAYNEVYKTGQPSKGLEWVLTRKDGSKVFLESSITLMHDSCGKPTGFRGIVRDISDRIRTQEALRESQQMLRLRIFRRKSFRVRRLSAKTGHSNHQNHFVSFFRHAGAICEPKSQSENRACSSR